MAQTGDDLERKLGDALADGKITDHDAEQVRTFAEFLSKAGPPPPYGCTPGDLAWTEWRDNALTQEQRAFRIHCWKDPDWREFLGLSPLPEGAKVDG